MCADVGGIYVKMQYPRLGRIGLNVFHQPFGKPYPAGNKQIAVMERRRRRLSDTHTDKPDVMRV